MIFIFKLEWTRSCGNAPLISKYSFLLFLLKPEIMNTVSSYRSMLIFTFFGGVFLVALDSTALRSSRWTACLGFPSSSTSSLAGLSNISISLDDQVLACSLVLEQRLLTVRSSFVVGEFCERVRYVCLSRLSFTSHKLEAQSQSHHFTLQVRNINEKPTSSKIDAQFGMNRAC